jgi:methylated-DNA-[protein]-cysteine S-methyltransferase
MQNASSVSVHIDIVNAWSFLWCVGMDSMNPRRSPPKPRAAPEGVDTVKCFSVVPSPLGELMLTSDGSALTGLVPKQSLSSHHRQSHWVRDDRFFVGVADQLEAYFHGRLRRFDVTLSLAGSAFQKQVWQALSNVPFGQRCSAEQLAERFGKSAAAVRGAVARNPVAIVVPCHRFTADAPCQAKAGAFEVWRDKLRAHERGAPLETAAVYSFGQESFRMESVLTRSS